VIRRGSRMTGGIAVGLLLAREYRFSVAAVTVSVLIGLPILWLTWASYRFQVQTAPGDGDLSLAGITDALAFAIKEQWLAEAMMRRLYDPYPLPVSWVPADPSLFESWDAIVAAAVNSPYQPKSSPASGWAASPTELRGSDARLADTFARVPTGRLVVLGEPGSGKSILMIRLVLDLLSRRQSGGAVPVLVSLASWNPAETDLHGWLENQLRINHPGLDAPAPREVAAQNRFQALLDRGLVIPMLDGLDEIPDAVRGVAIDEINASLRPGEPFVVTARTTPFRQAVSPCGGPEVILRGAAGIELLPLDGGTVDAYLRADAAGPFSAARWDPVSRVLGDTSSPVAQVFTTPLMASLARTIYNPRPGEARTLLPNPEELCVSFSVKAEIEQHLFDVFVPAAYRTRHQEIRHGFYPRQAEKWLEFLAHHLEQNIGGADFAWWQLDRALPRPLIGLVIATACACAASLAVGLVFGASTAAAAGLAVILVVGCAFGLPVELRIQAGYAWRHGSRAKLIVALVVTLTAGLLTGLIAGLATGYTATRLVGRSGGLMVGLAVGLVAACLVTFAVGFIVGLPMEFRRGRLRIEHTGLLGGATPRHAITWQVTNRIGFLVAGAAGIVISFTVRPTAGLSVFVAAAFAVGIRGVPGDLRTANSPQRVLIRDRRGSMLFLAVLAVIGLVWLGTRFTEAGWLVVGLTSGIVASSDQSLWPWWVISRVWLAMRGQLPWRLMTFLADAHERGVLRQSGAFYQFRHIELQHRLASRFQSRSGIFGR
jgi:hypothetical protein